MLANCSFYKLDCETMYWKGSSHAISIVLCGETKFKCLHFLPKELTQRYCFTLKRYKIFL